jgi:thiosulfate reductase / polysulfide reductase chain A
MYATIYPGKTQITIIWGSNPAESGTTVIQRLMEAKKLGMKLVVVDPRKTKVAQEADIWVLVRPRTRGALALGIAHVIIREGLYDRNFVDNYYIGFNDIKAVVDKYPPPRAAHISGVPVEMIEEVARLYATLKLGRFVPGVGLIHDGQAASRSNILARTILVALTGNEANHTEQLRQLITG